MLKPTFSSIASLILLLSLILILPLSCKKDILEFNMHYSDSCLLNNEVWKHNRKISYSEKDSFLQLHFESFYQEGFSKNCFTMSPFELGKYTFKLKDSLNNNEISQVFILFFEDQLYGYWTLDTSYGDDNWIRLDSISDNRDYVRGELNIHFFDKDFANRVLIKDNMIQEKMFIKNAKIEGKVVNF